MSPQEIIDYCNSQIANIRKKLTWKTKPAGEEFWNDGDKRDMNGQIKAYQDMINRTKGA